VILRTVAQSIAHAQALAKKFTGGKPEASVDAFLARRPRGIRRMSEVVLDASALLALLRDEPGAAKVADAIADDARMSSVNYAEVVSHLIHAGMPADQVDAMLRPLPMAVVAADHALAVHRRAPARRDGRGRPVARRPLLPWRLPAATACPR
jgi:hypothetical protein